MRLLHVITSLNSGGAEMMLFKLLSEGIKQSDSTVIALSGGGDVQPQIEKLGIPVAGLGFTQRMSDVLRVSRLVSAARRFQPDLIQSWMPHGNLATSLAAAWLRPRVPVIWNIRMSLDDLTSLSKTTKSLIRAGAMLSWNPAAIVYNSEAGARQHEAMGYRSRKTVVIPNGFACDIFRADREARKAVRAELGIREDAILVGLIARFDPMKDHAGFLRAARLIARSYPEVYFLLAGKGVEKDALAFGKLLSDPEVSRRAFLLGHRNDVPRLTAALDVACSTSTGEGFSNTVGEAMACAVPCVVTDVGDSGLLVADTGIVVPPGNPEAVAKAVCSLIEAGEQRRHELGVAARHRMEENFSMPMIASRYMQLYRQQLSTALD